MHSRKPYTYPKGSGRNEQYFKLAYGYWDTEDRWYRVLSLRAKAMLLVSLSLPASFVLPTERVPAWYGVSADTPDRGLRELDESGPATARVEGQEGAAGAFGHRAGVPPHPAVPVHTAAGGDLGETATQHLMIKLLDLERHLRRHGCELLREGSKHAIWWNPTNEKRSSVPRHRELPATTARAICTQLDIDTI